MKLLESPPPKSDFYPIAFNGSRCFWSGRTHRYVASGEKFYWFCKFWYGRRNNVKDLRVIC